MVLSEIKVEEQSSRPLRDSMSSCERVADEEQEWGRPVEFRLINHFHLVMHAAYNHFRPSPEACTTGIHSGIEGRDGEPA
jgi:hypothetical protein